MKTIYKILIIVTLLLAGCTNNNNFSETTYDGFIPSFVDFLTGNDEATKIEKENETKESIIIDKFTNIELSVESLDTHVTLKATKADKFYIINVSLTNISNEIIELEKMDINYTLMINDIIFEIDNDAFAEANSVESNKLILNPTSTKKIKLVYDLPKNLFEENKVYLVIAAENFEEEIDLSLIPLIPESFFIFTLPRFALFFFGVILFYVFLEFLEASLN